MSCLGADFVLVSLGGNDIHAGHGWLTVKNNIQTLVGGLRVPWGHIVVPRFYLPRLRLGRDGVHLTPSGARDYARILARNVDRAMGVL